MSPLWKSQVHLKWRGNNCVTLHFFFPQNKQILLLVHANRQALLQPPPGPVWHQQSSTRLGSHRHKHTTLPHISIPPPGPTGLQLMCLSCHMPVTARQAWLLAGKHVENYDFCSGIMYTRSWVDFWITKLDLLVILEMLAKGHSLAFVAVKQQQNFVRIFFLFLTAANKSIQGQISFQNRSSKRDFLFIQQQWKK